jgi:hypothetical protein
MQTVHVRVNDAATGQPTPVRIRFTGPDGTYYAPFGRLTEFATKPGVNVGGNVRIGSEAYAYIDGTCEVRLPPGRITVAISKGPEYLPVRTEVHLPPGKLALRFEVRRWIDLRTEGWYSGDTRAHNLTPHAALLEAAAEDLAVVNLLARESAAGSDGTRHIALPNILAFSGQRPALEMPGHQVVVNTLNRHPTLGELLLLNCHRPVYPLTFGGDTGLDDWSLADWCDQCHRKAGLVVGEGFLGGAREPAPGELLADLILGKVDALQLGAFDNPQDDFDWDDETVLDDWYKLLRSGFRVPVVGGSGKCSNHEVLGSRRTYARLPPGQEYTYKNWIEAVRAGRTFVTSGPLLEFTVNGVEPGGVVRLPASGGKVAVRAVARSVAAFDRLEVLCGAIGMRPTGTPPTASLEAELAFTRSGWLAARCCDSGSTPPWGPVAAQSSPVYVEVEGRPPRPDPAVVAQFTSRLDKMLRWAEREARYANDRQREHLADVFRSARAELLRRQEGTAQEPPRRGDGDGG